MRVLIIGNRGIQHALAARLESEKCHVDVYPGQSNPYYTSVSFEDAASKFYDLAVIGSPRYFDHPILDSLAFRGIPLFGPDRNAALLETSKASFKNFATTVGILTPDARAFKEIKLATAYIKDRKGPYVIKANGPSRGCGVAICPTMDEALLDLERKLVKTDSPYFAGEIVIEEYVNGFEVAVNIFLDGKDFHILPPTKPHKRRFDDDKGPMVAGMGSVAALPLNEKFYSELAALIIKPTLFDLNRRGWKFRGCLFVNLMLTNSSIYVLEYNCRMGDPAMLVDILLLKSSLSDLLEATVHQKLASYKPEISAHAACAITLCTHGYPDEQNFDIDFDVSRLPFLRSGMQKGIVIAGAEINGNFRHAKVTNGVAFSAIATGESLEAARANAYQIAETLPIFDKRTDIGSSISIPEKYAL